MKKTIIVTLVLLLFIIAGVTTAVVATQQKSDNTGRTLKSAQVTVYDDIDALLNKSDAVVIARIKEIEQLDDYYRYEIEPSEVVHGDFEGTEIINIFDETVAADGTSLGKTEDNFKKGYEYVFILQRINNVYYDKYFLAGGVCAKVIRKIAGIELVFAKPTDDMYTYVKNYDYSLKSGS